MFAYIIAKFCCAELQGGGWAVAEGLCSWLLAGCRVPTVVVPTQKPAKSHLPLSFASFLSGRPQSLHLSWAFPVPQGAMIAPKAPHLQYSSGSRNYRLVEWTGEGGGVCSSDFSHMSPSSPEELSSRIGGLVAGRGSQVRAKVFFPEQRTGQTGSVCPGLSGVLGKRGQKG